VLRRIAFFLFFVQGWEPLNPGMMGSLTSMFLAFI
jgi:hypothetical protein